MTCPKESMEARLIPMSLKREDQKFFSEIHGISEFKKKREKGSQ